MSKPRRIRWFPDVGDLVAIPIPNGRFVLIWVIGTFEIRKHMIFLVMEGSSAGMPTSDDVARSLPSVPPRAGQLPGYDNVVKGWTKGLVPPDFERVGTRDVGPVERGYVTNVSGTTIFGTPKALRESLHNRWREVHDREAYLAEVQERVEAYRAQQAARRRAMTLPNMLRERVFASWSEQWPAYVVSASRKIFRDATRALIALEAEGTPAARMEILRRIVTDFNDLDATHGCIETVERDEIVERIEIMAGLVGLKNDDEGLTGHRDW